MDDTTMLSIGSGIAQGLEKAATNLVNLQMARHKIGKEDELFKLQKKEAELKIKKMELIDFDPDHIIAEREKVKTESAAAKALTELRTAQIKSKEKEERLKFDQFKKEAQLLNAYQKGKLSVAPGETFRYGKFGIRAQTQKQEDDDFLNDKSGNSIPAGSANPNANNELDDFLSGFTQ